MSVNLLTQAPPAEPRHSQALENVPVKHRAETADRPEKEQTKENSHERLQAVLSEHDISLNFRRDEKSGQLVVELIDNKTGEAVRQMPSEVSLKLGEAFERVQGQFIEARV
jgi:uncharacterized FlaG/YvyC family protein